MNLGTVMGVRAHPDDETYLAAGLFAHAVDLGSRVVDVTATRGEGPARSRSISSSSATSSARASRAISAVTGSMSRVPVLSQRPGHLAPHLTSGEEAWAPTQPRRLRAATYLCFMYWSHQQTSARSSPLPSGAMRPAR